MSKKKLYEVEITTTMYVLAEDDDEAESIADDHRRDEDNWSYWVTRVRAGHAVDGDWRESIPFGGSGEGKSVGAHLKDIEDAAEFERLQVKLPIENKS